ncbi:MAG: alkaline phosphatase D family protein [Pseudonocardiaceae bacterium]
MTTLPSSRCARLLLGPALRHVGRTTAAVWVQTDRPAEVEVLGCRASTFTVREQHYALVEVNLEPGSVTTYQVHLNGKLAWPAPGSPWPDSRIHTRGSSAPVRMVFGSCRHAKPEGPRSVAAEGIDALDVTAGRMADMAPEDWPDALLLLGDQVYADDPTPQTRRWLHSCRRDTRDTRDTSASPEYEVADFTEYARLYRDSWSGAEIRWLMSTVPTAMIFDDHDVRDDWNTSSAWRAWVTAQPWWPARIRGALAAYWIYQHIGNLPPKERHSDPTWGAVQEADGDAWPVLQASVPELLRPAGRVATAGLGRALCTRDDQRAVRRCAPQLCGTSRLQRTSRRITCLPTGVLAGAPQRPVVCHSADAGRLVRSAGRGGSPHGAPLRGTRSDTILASTQWPHLRQRGGDPGVFGSEGRARHRKGRT